jgi:insulysin
MLFIGSTKYEDPNIFSKVVEKGGGFDNAYTSAEETNFYFVTGSNELNQALDIFSWFFIDPLLNSKDIEKEVQNVDSEHRK